jgi:phenylpropionate dioxygenase-like ring-hydroxylating dioxygenase large terminal subunit
LLSTDNNQLLTRVGPGTIMGDLLRQYWVPAMLSSELPKADCDPVRVVLLGERLVAFRDTSGAVGMLSHRCPHRGASLFFGRNERHGLRCVYHGWKFDVTGRCVDMPSEPPESTFKDRVAANSYPCVERGGLVWAYLGPRENPPPLPDLEANTVENGQWVVDAVLRECNWMQALEGDIDTSHFNFLHTGGLDPEDADPDTFLRYQLENRAPRYQILDTSYGAMYGAYRPAGEGRKYWRIGQFLFPFYTNIPVGLLGHKIQTRAWVPMDDNTTMFFNIDTKAYQEARRRVRTGPRSTDPRVRATPTLSPLLPNTKDWYGRFRLDASSENDYRIDREWQRAGNYTGIEGIHTQDQAVTESMGPIMDRTTEHLGTSDVMVIRVRRRLLEAARALRERGVVPESVDDPSVYRTRSGGIILDEDADWVAATRNLRQAYVDHPGLDLSLDRM